MKRVYIFPLLIATMLGCSHTIFSAISEQELDCISADFREIECRATPLPYSVMRAKTTPTYFISDNRREQGSRPHNPISASSLTNSLNWSGYAALTDIDNPENYSVQKALGSWTVPTLTATENDSYSVAFIGIDGFFDNLTATTVEQIGTAHNWIDGAPEYFAWFEMYGPITEGGLQEIVDFPVAAGDVMFGLVKYNGQNTFTLKLVNLTQQAKTKIDVAYTAPFSYTFQPLAPRTSAEWVVEAPSSGDTILPLANFGTVAFSDCSATIKKHKGKISDRHWESTEINMVNSDGDPKATTSSLSSDGEAFTITWVASE